MRTLPACTRRLRADVKRPSCFCRNRVTRYKPGSSPCAIFRRERERHLSSSNLPPFPPMRSRDAAARPQLRYQAGAAAQQQLKDTYLGKTLLITGHKEWSDAQVIRAYRSQFVIEEIFHEMKDRHIGAWWPLHHWTDSKIQVHG